MYHQAQHSKILHGARFAFSVLYGSQNRQRPLLYTSLIDWFFITVVESVYSAVRTDSIYKADYVSLNKRVPLINILSVPTEIIAGIGAVIYPKSKFSLKLTIERP